jgi:cytochrome c oxidase subunit II
MTMTIDRNRRQALRAAGAVLLAGSAAALVAAESKPRVIKVIARKFVFVPAEIRVKKGETVVLQFTAPEVPMGFNLPDFSARADIIPGKVSTLRLTPDKTGSFTFACDVFCGSGHEDMAGTLIVT